MLPCISWKQFRKEISQIVFWVLYQNREEGLEYSTNQCLFFPICLATSSAFLHWQHYNLFWKITTFPAPYRSDGVAPSQDPAPSQGYTYDANQASQSLSPRNLNLEHIYREGKWLRWSHLAVALQRKQTRGLQPNCLQSKNLSCYKKGEVVIQTIFQGKLLHYSAPITVYIYLSLSIQILSCWLKRNLVDKWTELRLEIEQSKGTSVGMQVRQGCLQIT